MIQTFKSFYASIIASYTIQLI